MSSNSARAHRRSFAQRSVVRFSVAAALGVVVGVCVGLLLRSGMFAVMSGWLAMTVVYGLWTWFGIRGMDEHQTAAHAQEEDPGVVGSDVMLFGSSMASLVGVGVLLAAGGHKAGTAEALLGAGCVVAAWMIVHLVYVLRYARLYYGDGPGAKGIDFPGGEPDYYDFAYLSYCLGMTYQISDTNLQNRQMRRVVLAHTMLSYLFGVGIIATTINLVVQLASG